MVQIIPRAKGGLEQFLEAMSGATRDIGEGIGNIKGAMNEREERNALANEFGDIYRNVRDPRVRAEMLSGDIKSRQSKADLDRKKAYAEQIMNDPALEGFDEGMKRAYAYEAAGITSGGSTKSLINALREKGSDTRLADLFNENEGFSPSQNITTPEEAPIQSRGTPDKSTRDYDKEIKKWTKGLADPDPRNREFAKNMIAQLNNQKEFEFKTGKEKKRSDEALRNETMPIRKEIAEKARSAQQGIENKQRLIETIETGNIDDPTYAVLAQLLPFRLGERLLSPESVVYRAGIIDEYKDLRTIFQGQTRMKEIDLLEDKIASLYLTDEQKKAILSSRIDALQSDVIRGEAAAELEAEGDFGGALQFQKKVDERSKEKMEGLFNRILDQQQAIIKDAENLKNMKLDINNPEHVAIVDQILAEANGNWKEAEKSAKKKGYKF